jgi:hypothetical protein
MVASGTRRAVGPGRGTIAPQVQESELRRSRAKHPPASTPTNACYGFDLLYRVEDDPWSQALPLFDRVIVLEPRFDREPSIQRMID